jgi:UPF0755 protein
VTSIMDPEVTPSPAREIAHRSKGCLAVIVALAVLGFGGYFVWDKASTYISTIGETPDFVGAGKGQITVTIPSGASLDDIGRILTEQKVIESTKAWDKAVRSEERATSIQAGRYLMRTQIPARDALRVLINPGESRIRSLFTIREGLRLSAQVSDLVKETKIKKRDFNDVLKDPSALGLPRYANNRPEGFLFPETYELVGDSTATSVLKRMVTQYNTVSGQLGLEARAKAMHRSPYDVLIVASIVEREVSNPSYRTKVARVLYNRLDQGQKLELDSTVLYALDSSHTTTTPDDRKVKSKYNTYRHKGLPPGPISAPGRDALRAAANPATGTWLYFTTINFDTGETRFATTFAEHEKNVALFQAWCNAKGNAGKCS